MPNAGVIASARTGEHVDPPAEAYGFHGLWVQTNDAKAYTFLAVPIGTPSPTRRVILAIFTNSTRTLEGATIGGVPAEWDADYMVNGTGHAALWSAVVPSGTVADVVVNIDPAANAMGLGLGVWSLATGVPTGMRTQARSDGEPVVLTIDTAPGDLVIGLGAQTTAVDATFNWDAGTERFDQDFYSSTTGISATDLVATGPSTTLSLDVEGTLPILDMALIAAYGEPVVNPDPSFVLTFQGSLVDPTDLTTYTLLAVPIGTPGPTRRVILGITGAAGAARTFVDVTIGGVTATQDAYFAGASNRRVGIYSAVVPDGETADVVVTWSAAMVRIGIGVWTIPHGGPTGVSAADGDAKDGRVTLATEPWQVVVAVGSHSVSSGTPGEFTWGGANVRYEEETESLNTHSGADVIAGGPFVDVSYYVTTGQAWAMLAAAYAASP